MDAEISIAVVKDDGAATALHGSTGKSAAAGSQRDITANVARVLGDVNIEEFYSFDAGHTDSIFREEAELYLRNNEVSEYIVGAEYYSGLNSEEPSDAYIELTEFRIFEEPLDGEEVGSVDFARVLVTVHGGGGADTSFSVIGPESARFSFGFDGDADELTFVGGELEEPVTITVRVVSFDRQNNLIEAFFELTVTPRDVDIAPRIQIT